jgi:hypothetical protein
MTTVTETETVSENATAIETVIAIVIGTVIVGEGVIGTMKTARGAGVRRRFPRRRAAKRRCR